MSKGLFIVIEGGDGSGKGTQAEKLRDYFAQNTAHNVLKLSFPRYDEFSSIYVKNYLNGMYGQADEVHGDLASLPYAIDRYAASKDIREHLVKENSIVICDRYVASNLAHQGTKFYDDNSRIAYYKRNMKLEYDILSIPKPDINIVLLVPTDIAQLNVDKKDRRSYTKKKRDIHEANASHLTRANLNYRELCRIYPEDFRPIECTVDGKMRSIDDVHQEILFLIETLKK